MPPPVPFQLTDAPPREAERFAVVGFDPMALAEWPGVDEKVLRNHFAREIKRARMRSLGETVSHVVCATLGASAKYDDKGNCIRAEVRPEAWAFEFMLKLRDRFEDQAGGTDPLEGLNLPALDDDEWSEFKRLLAKCGYRIQVPENGSQTEG